MSSAGNSNPEVRAPQADRRRLFLALWPDDDVRRRLRYLLDTTLRIRSGRPEPIANLHVTLVFIGNIPGERVNAIERAVADVSGTAFELLLERVGYWGRPRIMWLGSRETPSALLSLVKDLRAALVPCGITAETRPYLPHMTLARKVQHPPFTGVVEQVTWRVDTFSLLESVPLERGSAYRELAAWPLQSSDKPHEPWALSD